MVAVVVLRKRGGGEVVGVFAYQKSHNGHFWHVMEGN